MGETDNADDADLGALAAAAAGADAGLAAAVDGRFAAVTDRWCELWGQARETVVNSPVAEGPFADPADGPPAPGESVRVEHASVSARGDDTRDEGEGGSENGSFRDPPRTLEVAADTAAVDGTTYRVYTCRDVTDQVANERDSNVLDALFRHIPVYLYIKDERGRHLRVSEYNEQSDGFVGKTDLEVFGGENGAETFADDMQVIQRGEHIVDKEEIDHEHNEYYLSSKVPWRDEDGDIQGLIGVTHNISDQERRLRQLERQNERLRTVASVISHDIRNPLQVAQGRLELARQAHDDGDLDKAADALDRMGSLLEELLAMVRHGQWVEETEPVPVRRTAETIWATAAGDPATLQFDREFRVEADEARLQQLLENLFRNAVVHGREDVHVRIGPLDDIGFYVEDDGPGIPEDEREEVFESGYTTAEEGTGFGLAIVQVIAEAHGWSVRLTESDAGGARFEFVGVEFG